MTRTNRPFPVAFRVLATACALFLLAVFVPAASADDPTKQDVIDARQRERELEAQLTAKRAELDEIEARLAETAFEVDQQEGLLEEIQVELLKVQDRIERAQARYARLREQLNDRAAEAYMQGPGSDLGFLLDASTFTELTDRLEFVDAVNASDAALAQEVANLDYQLGLDQASLEDMQRRETERLDRIRQIEDQLEADLERAEELRAELAADVAAAAEETEQTQEAWEEYLARISTPAHSSVPMPAGWAKVLEVCPVDTPRAFGDGFGAPRYVGGYHPHRGVDIVAPEGTPVRATFDGIATDSTNDLGGISVRVTGRYGYTYNAHLQSIAKLGSVRAGDVIGYVSSTGLAGGSTPHNHFEFWPNVIPADWPQSYYGYSQIDGAINPYPMLVAACG
jgi:murein DD-endopeptidase MepM/ murein hydrolase activator NlpD